MADQKRNRKTTAPRPRRVANAMGAAARRQIVNAAETVLRTDGYHALSARKVASACGISVGNLTYYFPGKADLLEAVMDDVCNRYAEERDATAASYPADPDAYLRKTVTWLITDAASEETSALFLELWVLAKHHDFGRDIVERFYATAAQWIADGLADRFPGAPPETYQQAAYYLLTLSEGSTALFSRPAKRPVAVDAIIAVAYETVRRMLPRDGAH